VPAAAHGKVLRNATWLVAAQVLGAPVAIGVNAVLGRTLGAADFGFIYLASTLCGLGLHLVEWGQATALPGLVAVDRPRAGLLLGSTLAWRAAASALVFGGLAAASLLLDWDPSLRAAVALVGAAMALGSLARACHDAVRGLERTELAALAIAGQPLLTAAVVVPVLLLGGGLRGALAAQVAVAALGLCILLLALRPMGITGLAVGREALRQVVRAGSPFLVLGVAVALQPNVDALLLSRLSPPEVVGWHAASMKLVGALVFPASSLITALYPTLFRLHAEDRAAYRATAAAALRTATVLVVPLALGCGLYPEVGVAIFGEAAFAPALANLRALAPYVFLLYFTMTLGCCLSAAGRERPWALLQVGCVLAAAALDLLLIPWFQARTGNGGLGVAATLLLCEVLVLVGAAWLAPKGLLDRRFLATALRAAGGGLAMTLVAVLLRGLHPFAAAPLSVLAYTAVLLALAGREEVGGLLEPLRRRFRRAGGP
jgi:O-antigen/teichoic acid export membrane protein